MMLYTVCQFSYPFPQLLQLTSIAVQSCQNGPGKSCPLESYAALIAQKSKSQGSLVQTCGLTNSTGAASTNTATFLVDNALSWEYVVKP